MLADLQPSFSHTTCFCSDILPLAESGTAWQGWSSSQISEVIESGETGLSSWAQLLTHNLGLCWGLRLCGVLARDLSANQLREVMTCRYWHFRSARIMSKAGTSCRFTWLSRVAPAPSGAVIIQTPHRPCTRGVEALQTIQGFSFRNIHFSTGMSLLTIWEMGPKRFH